MSSSHVVTTAVPSVTSQPINGSFYTHSPSTSSTLVVANPPSFNRTSVSCKLLVCLFSLIFENDSVVNIQRIFYEFSLDSNFSHSSAQFAFDSYVWVRSEVSFFSLSALFRPGGHIIFSILLLLLAQQCIRYIAAFFGLLVFRPPCS